MTFAKSFSEAPKVNRDLTNKSNETVGSPVSIFATRDWLELIILANCSCVIFCFVRCFFKCSLSASFNSIYLASSDDNPRNSVVVPTFHPFFSSIFFLVFFIMALPSCSRLVLFYSLLAYISNWLRRTICFLFEYLQNYDRIRFNPVTDSP